MFGKQMTALQTRKQALLLESDLNRLRLRAELSNLRESTRFGKNLLLRFGSWTSLLIPVAGVIVTLVLRRSSVVGAILRKTLVSMPPLIRLWRTVSSLLAEFR